MAPQLRLVSPEVGPEPLASFRADARLRLWDAGLCACGAIAMTAAGYHRTLSALRYRLTPQRMEVERGILGKRYESIDLWRVRDVMLDQTLLERVRGVGRITVLSTDQLEPELLVGPIASAKPLYDRLRDAVAAARKEARVVPLG
jgi:uncharacterized membrane protein YdbT with pleckstrin-like domain